MRQVGGTRPMFGMFPILGMICVIMLLLAACEGSSDGGDADGRGRDGARGAEKRPAKVAGVPTKAGTHKLKLEVGTPGHREYLLRVPPKLTKGRFRDRKPVKPLPLVLAMHGGLANMTKMESLSGFNDLADSKGFLVAYPDGFMTTWNAGDCCGAAKIGKIDDVGFLTKLIDKLTKAGLADPDRVYATGFSNGAGMAYRMACERPGKVAAIGVVSAALAMDCDPAEPTSVMVFHGTADRSVPYAGGGDRDFNDKRPFPPVSQAIDFWRRQADLPELRETVYDRGDTTCRSTGEGGRADVEVALCRIDGGGHRWPDEAAGLLWKFFAAHPRN